MGGGEGARGFNVRGGISNFRRSSVERSTAHVRLRGLLCRVKPGPTPLNPKP